MKPIETRIPDGIEFFRHDQLRAEFRILNRIGRFGVVYNDREIMAMRHGGRKKLIMELIDSIKNQPVNDDLVVKCDTSKKSVLISRMDGCQTDHIKVDLDTWPAIRAAVDQLIGYCEKVIRTEPPQPAKPKGRAQTRKNPYLVKVSDNT